MTTKTVWGTTVQPHSAMELAFARHAAPRYGGEVIEELVTAESVNEPSERYRWRDGYRIERTWEGAYLCRIGEPKSADVFIHGTMIAYAGTEQVDQAELERSIRIANTERPGAPKLLASDADIDAAVEPSEALGELLTAGYRLPEMPEALVELAVDVVSVGRAR